MARLKQDTSVERNKSNNTMHKQTSSSLASRSSLAAAATGITSSNNSNTFVPSFKKNPLNAAAAVYTVSESSTTSTNNKTISNQPTIATTNHVNQVTTITPSTTPTAAAQEEEASTKKMTLIQQLIHYQKSPDILPLPFSMCSESEALDRQQHLELSPFECNPSSMKSGVMLTLSSENDTMGSKKAAARRHRPTFNSQYVIKKYRRSAAGGGALSEASDKCPRTLDQLQTTVDYLLGSLFANQMPPIVEDCIVNTDPNEISIWEEDGDDMTKQTQQQQQQQHTPFSLSETVSFIDDRLRAVQKDLVTLLGNIEEPNLISSSGNSVSAKRQQLKEQRTKHTVRDMQAKMVRYNILASYLLSDVPSSKYEVKFGARSLRTSLTCYLNLSTTIHEEYQSSSSSNQQQQSAYNTECQTQDEIMAYMALLHSSAVLRNEENSLPPPTSNEITSSLMEDSGSGWGALLTTFCKHVLDNENNSTNGVVDKYPRWKWALELACVAQEGNYQRYFALLEKGPTYSSSYIVEDDLAQASNTRLLILARCCTSHSLNLVRLAQLRRHNHAFGKGEKVPATNLARLLRFNIDSDQEVGTQRAVEFCRGVGLPIIEKEVGDDKVSYVVMKSTPISVKGDETIHRICNPGRMNDVFVFGSKFEIGGDVESLTKQMEKQCGVEASWEDEEGNDESFAIFYARKDEDGVEIPSSNVLSILSCLK